jgi:hypothetical protein
MLTIEPIYNKFKIKFSNPGSGWRGWSISVNSVAEIHTVIDHYHGLKHKESKCPLCRKDKQS